jgi:hypothetical protein
VSDDLRAYSRAEQAEIIGSAKEVLERLAGRRVLAFRSGNFFSDRTTLLAARGAGIRITSNYNLRYADRCSYVRELPLTNDWFVIEDGIELPISSFRQSLPNRRFGLLQLSGSSATELCRSLTFAHARGCDVVTILLHSFELVRPSDPVQFTGLVPNEVLIHRFRAVANHLASHRERFEVTNCEALAASRLPRLAAPRRGPFWTSPPWTVLGRLAANHASDVFQR